MTVVDAEGVGHGRLLSPEVRQISASTTTSTCCRQSGRRSQSSDNLIEPNTLFLPYRNQLDGRVGKTFRFGKVQAQGFVDIFNVLNAGTITSVVQTYGASWYTPTAILTGC